MEWLILVALGVATLAAPVIAISLFARYEKKWMVRLTTNQPDAPGGPPQAGARPGVESIPFRPFRPRRVRGGVSEVSHDRLPGHALWPRRVVSSGRPATTIVSPGSRLDASVIGIGLHNSSLQPACAPSPMAHLPASAPASGGSMTTGLQMVGEAPGPLRLRRIAPILSIQERGRKARINRLARLVRRKMFLPATMAGLSLLLTLGLISLGFADLVLVQYMVSFGLCLLVWGLTTDARAGQGKAHATTDRRGTPAVKQDTRTDLPAAA